ncbi:MAG: hypothetical protein F4Z15_06575 [Gammaproteobacteria bacterium]|nr:hypothetical protein [Gammaproteobacteria bacterium]
MLRLLLLIPVLAVVPACESPTAPPEPPVGSLRVQVQLQGFCDFGTVICNDDDEIVWFFNNVEVKLDKDFHTVPPTPDISLTAMTSDQGEVRFENLPPGRYIVSVPNCHHIYLNLWFPVSHPVTVIPDREGVVRIEGVPLFWATGHPANCGSC